MKRFVITGLLAGLLASTAQAGPIRFIKRQFREHPTRTQLIYTGLVSGVAARGLYVCRQQNVENCEAHYGAAWASYGVDVAGVALADFLGHKIGGKTGQVIAYGSSTVLLGFGAWEWHGGLNKPSEDHKPDLSHVTFVKH